MLFLKKCHRFTNLRTRFTVPTLQRPCGTSPGIMLTFCQHQCPLPASSSHLLEIWQWHQRHVWVSRITRLGSARPAELFSAFQKGLPRSHQSSFVRVHRLARRRFLFEQRVCMNQEGGDDVAIEVMTGGQHGEESWHLEWKRKR